MGIFDSGNLDVRILKDRPLTEVFAAEQILGRECLGSIAYSDLRIDLSLTSASAAGSGTGSTFAARHRVLQ